MTSSVIYVIVDGVRADRLLSMLWLLRTHGSLSTKELANRLEVSRRTILRDVEALSAAGIPVYCERGARGGVRLLSGYRTDVTALNEDESRALFASFSSWGPNAIGLSDAFASGVRKLLAAVPETLRSQSVTIASRIFIDPQGWLPRPSALEPGESFPVVQAGVFRRQCLQIFYRSRQAVSAVEVIVEPHGLISAGSDWYLCASDKGSVRFFKVSRIEAATLMPIPCCGPDIDLVGTWQAHRAKFLEQFNPLQVTGSIRSERWEDAREWSIWATENEPSDAMQPCVGWKSVRLEFMDDLHAMSVLLRLGADIRVDAPKRIVTKLLAQIDEIQSLYVKS